MNAQDDLVVTVHGTWDGWQHAEVRLSDLRDVHWLQPDRAPHRIIHGFIFCGQLLNGTIPHGCDARSAPHELLVCVLKRHAVSSAYAELARRADAFDGRQRESIFTPVPSHEGSSRRAAS